MWVSGNQNKTPSLPYGLAPVLKQWLALSEQEPTTVLNLTQAEQDKKLEQQSSVLDHNAIAILEAQYSRNKNPSFQQMSSIANALDYDKEIVKKWFLNRGALDSRACGSSLQQSSSGNVSDASCGL